MRQKDKEALEDVKRYRKIIQEEDSKSQRNFFVNGCINILGLPTTYRGAISRAKQSIEDYKYLWNVTSKDIEKITGVSEQTLKRIEKEDSDIDKTKIYQVILELTYGSPKL